MPPRALHSSAARLFAASDLRAATRLRSVADARAAAQRRLPAVVFDYIDGGADAEITMRANELAFEARRFRPRVAAGRLDPDLRTTVLGTELELPVMLAPCGLVRAIHPDGPAGVARAAAARGTVSVVSTVSGCTLEEVRSSAPVPVWFQLYASGGLTQADELCAGAAAADVEVLMVTVDTPALGNRLRDVHHGVTPPLRVDAHNAVQLGRQVLLKPQWALRMAATGLRLTRRAQRPAASGGTGMLAMAASPFSWRDIAHLRERWTGHLVIKGLLTGDDARRAVDAGADAVVVSNHGGRQLDGAPATLVALPEVVSAVGDRTEVLVDSGVRRGSDVVLALSLGARAVLVGRPYLYGLAAAGQPGVAQVLDVLAAEIHRTLLLLGCASVKELGPEWVVPHGA